MKKTVFLLLLSGILASTALDAQAPVFNNPQNAFQPSFTNNDYTRDIKQISGGEYVVAGSWEAGAPSGLNGYLSYYNASGILQRTVTFVSNGGDDLWGVDAISTASTSDIYVTGYFTGSMTVSLTISPFSIILATVNAPSGNPLDVTYFVAKLNQAGSLVWIYTAGTAVNSREEGRDVTVQQVGGTRLVYTTGLFRGTTGFLGATPTVPATSTGFGDDGFVAAYTDNGTTANINWVTRISGTSLAGNDLGQALDADAFGNVYVTGGYKGGSANFTSAAPAPGISTSVAYGNDDAFVVSYTPAGAAIAAVGYGGSAAGPGITSPVEQGRGIVVNSTNDIVYVSGYYIGYNAPNIGSFGGSALTGGYEGFFVAMKASTLLPGLFRTIRTAGSDFCYRMDIDPSNNNITAVAGSFGGATGMVYDESNTLIYSQPGCGGISDGFLMRNDAGTGTSVLGTVCGTSDDAVTAVDIILNYSFICGHSKSPVVNFEASTPTVTNTGAPSWEGFSAQCNYYSITRKPSPFNENEQSVLLYPNPANQQFVIDLGNINLIETPVQLHLVDLSGRIIKQTNLTQTQTEITVDELPSGVYFWQLIRQDAILEQGKIVISH